MTCIVSYDVSDDKRRDRLSHILLDYGTRIQESVFWVDGEDDTFERMRARVTAAADKEDSVWIVPICQACGKRIQTLGVARVPKLAEYYVL